MCVYNSSLLGHFKTSLFHGWHCQCCGHRGVNANVGIISVYTGDIWRIPCLGVRGKQGLQTLVGVGNGMGCAATQEGNQTWSTAGIGPD